MSVNEDAFGDDVRQKLAILEQQKAYAVSQEDYDTAQDVKMVIDRVKLMANDLV